MRQGTCAPDIPVLLLYDIDPAWPPEEQQKSAELTESLARAIAGVGHPVEPVLVRDSRLREALRPYNPSAHVVLNWCESLPGVPSSEPHVPRVLEELRFVYTGSDETTLVRAQDKSGIKATLQRAGIPTPRWRVYETPEPGDWSRFPAIVKTSMEHCSEGLSPESVVLTRDELRRRIAWVLDTFGQPALVEDFIDGREFHVSLWGNGVIDLLPPAEMDFSRLTDIHQRLCTYDSKFDPDSPLYQEIGTLLPAPLTESEMASLEEVCRRAYRVAGCRDYARLDVRLRDGVFHVLDINPNADISADASMACAAEVAGYSYGQFASRLIQLAAHRHPRWGK